MLEGRPNGTLNCNLFKAFPNKMPRTSCTDNEINALGLRRCLNDGELSSDNHIQSPAGGKYHTCIPILEEHSMFIQGVIPPRSLPRYPLISQKSVRFQFGGRTISHPSPPLRIRLSICLLIAWNSFLGKKLFDGRRLRGVESHRLQFRHVVERFTIYFLSDSFQLPGANIYLLLPLIGSDW